MSLSLLEEAIPLMPRGAAVGGYGGVAVWVRGMHEDDAVDLGRQAALAEGAVKDGAHRVAVSR